jgi:hypothetical protein
MTDKIEREFSDDYLLRMWLLWIMSPARDTRDATGAVHLGEIGPTPERNWRRTTPYSVAKPTVREELNARFGETP